MIVECYPDGSFNVNGEPEEIAEYLMLIRKKQDEYELKQARFNILEAIKQFKKEKKESGNKYR